MINMANITSAIESILKANLSGAYHVQRNPERNSDPSVASVESGGWIGIYRGSNTISPITTGLGGGGTPWNNAIKPVVEVQRASMTSGADAEDKLEASVNDVLTVLTDRSNLRLNGTVNIVTGFSVEYQFDNSDKEVWFHSALITINAEVRG